MKDLNCKIKQTSNDIAPFDIVTSPYVDINGTRKIGLFLVIYTEQRDPNDFNNRNVTGLKLTSKDLYANMYRTLVTREDVPCLASDSYIYSNKLSTLLVSHCRFVSKLPVNLCEEVIGKLQSYLSQVTIQTTNGLSNILKGGN